MNKNRLLECVRLTEEVISRFWQKDCDYMLSFMPEDAVWIGAQMEQFVCGRENIREVLYSVKNEMKVCNIFNGEYIVAQNCGNCCTVAGRYFARVDKSEGFILQAQQRLTFSWQLYNDKLQISCMHISNPIGELRVAKGESFVNTIGKNAYKYIHSEIEAVVDNRKLCAEDTNGSMRIITLSDIIYAEADRRNVRVHTFDEAIDIKIKWSDFLQKTGEALLSVHRSYAVNLKYILSVKEKSVEMVDKTRIPVPDKRFNEIRQKIVDAYNY